MEARCLDKRSVDKRNLFLERKRLIDQELLKKNRNFRYNRAEAVSALARYEGSHEEDARLSHLISHKVKAKVEAKKSTKTLLKETLTKNEKTVVYNYRTIALEILKSLTNDERIKKFLGNVLLLQSNLEHKCNFLTVVLWPNMWEGIWKQLCLDLPRESVSIKINDVYVDAGTRRVEPLKRFPKSAVQNEFKEPFELLMFLQSTVGSLWSRWVCAFLTQATMADVFKSVWLDAKERFGPQTVVCERKGDCSGLRIIMSISSASLSIEFLKEFRVLLDPDSARVKPCEGSCSAANGVNTEQSSPSDEIVVKTHYKIVLLPDTTSELNYFYT